MTARDFALWLYSGMLRLYPARFRAEFAEEMEQVFGLRLNEVKGNGTLLGWLVVELLDLPFNIIREHWRERRQHSIQLFYSRGYMVQRLYSPRLFRFCAITILVFCGLYLLSAVSAFFAFNLHTNSLQNSYNWWYASDNYWRFMSRQLPIRLFVSIIYMLIVPWILTFGSVLGLNVVMRWQALTLRERRLAKIVFSAAILTLLSWLTPLGAMGGLWFYD